MSASFEVGLKVDVKGLNTVKDFRSGLGSLANDLSKVRISEKETRNGITKLTAEISNNLTPAEAKLVRQLIKKAGAQATVTKVTKASEVATENLTDAVQDNEKALKDEADALKKAAKETKDKEAADKRAEKAERKLAEETRRHAAALKQLEDKLNAVTKAHSRRAANATRNSFLVQNKVQDTDNNRFSNQQAIVGAQSAASQTRHTNAVLRQQAAHQLQLQRMQLQHQNAMQRIAAYNRSNRGGFGPNGGVVGNVGSLPGVGKVIAYDALRRILTNIYQTVGRVGDEIVEWTKNSIMFNDEMERSKIVFQGFGLIGQKNKDGSAMSLMDAKKNPAMANSVDKLTKFSEGMIGRMVALSAETGQSSEEIIASSRQLMADLINKKTKKGGTSPLLDDKMSTELSNTTEEMVRLAAVLKMSDPGGRALKWHMVPIQELFSGSSGNAKDGGLQNVRSMMLREGIKIREEDAKPIAQAVNKGDIAKASELIQKVLEKAGQGVTTFSNLLEYTLMPNIDAIKTAFGYLSGVMNNPLYQHLIVAGIKYRKIMLNLMKDDGFLALMKDYGVKFRNAFRPLITPVNDFFQKLRDTKGDSLKPYLDTFMSVTKNFNIIFANFIKGVVGFFSGLLGVNSKDAFDAGPMIRFSEQFAHHGEVFGKQMRKMSEKIMEAVAPLERNFFPAMTTLGEMFIKLTDWIEPLIRNLAAVVREIANMPFVGDYINYTVGEDRANEFRDEVDSFVMDGGRGTGKMDETGMFAEGFVSPMKFLNYTSGNMFRETLGYGDEGVKRYEKYNPGEEPFQKFENFFNSIYEKFNNGLGDGYPKNEEGFDVWHKPAPGATNSADVSVNNRRNEESVKTVTNIMTKLNMINTDKSGKISYSPWMEKVFGKYNGDLSSPNSKDNATKVPYAYGYKPLTTTTPATYNVPKQGISISKGIGEKEFITIANKVVAEKFKAINKPFIVKPDKVHNETKITIGSISVTSNDPKKFVDGLKNTGGSNKDNSTPIPYAPDYKARL